MKVVIDTNVVVSAALRGRDPEGIILWVVAQSDWQWIVSREILVEYREVLGRERLRLPPGLRARWLDLVERRTTPIAVPTAPDFPRDPKDALFLACALTAQADYLVTGDKDFTAARLPVTTQIVSVAQFKRLVCAPTPGTGPGR
ncbi:MAG: putative toxin-antitoxin system toxin component, PIN family [Planctomycetes bacterium]|nr:putative toxin-antitoxin system toxin component, PIN family [Planctomycetota bacterium]